MDLSDKELLDQFTNDETRNYAFNILVRQYQKRLYWHIRKILLDHDDTNDVLQNVFIKVWRNLAGFKAESQLYTWLYRIATNECSRHFRRNKNQMKNSGLAEKMVGELSGTDSENSDAILFKFQQAIMQLPERQRIVFNLRYYDELSYDDIGQILNSSVNSLKTNYHYASEKIKQYLIDHA